MKRFAMYTALIEKYWSEIIGKIYFYKINSIIYDGRRCNIATLNIYYIAVTWVTWSDVLPLLFVLLALRTEPLSFIGRILRFLATCFASRLSSAPRRCKFFIFFWSNAWYWLPHRNGYYYKPCGRWILVLAKLLRHCCCQLLLDNLRHNLDESGDPLKSYM